MRPTPCHPKYDPLALSRKQKRNCPPNPNIENGHDGNENGRQQAMQPAERTALLIGACEWGDLAALERLLELGEKRWYPVVAGAGVA